MPGRAIALAVLMLFTACGFQPMYGDDTRKAVGSPLDGNLAIDRIGNGHEGQVLKSALEDRFNPDGAVVKNAEYRLQIGLNKTLIPSVVKSDGTIQRYDVRMDSDFKMYKRGTVPPVFTGTLRRTGSYNLGRDVNFGSYEAQQDTVARVLRELAEDYTLRLSSYILEEHPQPAPPPGVSE